CFITKMAPKSSCQHPTRHAERDKPSKWTKAVSAALAYYMTNRYNKYVSLSKFKIKEGDPLCTPTKITVENNETINIRVSEFALPCNNQSYSPMSIIVSLSTDENRGRARRAKDAQRKRRERLGEKKRESECEVDRNRRAESRSGQIEVEREAGRTANRQQMIESRSCQTTKTKEKNPKLHFLTRAIRNAEVKQTKTVPLPWPSRIPYDTPRNMCYFIFNFSEPSKQKNGGMDINSGESALSDDDDISDIDDSVEGEDNWDDEVLCEETNGHTTTITSEDQKKIGTIIEKMRTTIKMITK
ncbi:unnamed protein product, partial [Didymodactylos carnosus]